MAAVRPPLTHPTADPKELARAEAVRAGLAGAVARLLTGPYQPHLEQAEIDKIIDHVMALLSHETRAPYWLTLAPIVEAAATRQPQLQVTLPEVLCKWVRPRYRPRVPAKHKARIGHAVNGRVIRSTKPMS